MTGPSGLQKKSPVESLSDCRNPNGCRRFNRPGRFWFSGLPLTGALANTFGTAVGVFEFASSGLLGQIAAIFVWRRHHCSLGDLIPFCCHLQRQPSGTCKEKSCAGSHRIFLYVPCRLFPLITCFSCRKESYYGKNYGIFPSGSYLYKEKGRYLHYLDDMTQAFETAFPHLIQKSSSFLSDHSLGLAQTEFSSASLPVLPLIKRDCGQTFGIVLDGELYNAPELSAELTSRKRAFDPSSDADILLTSYLNQPILSQRN